MVKSSSREKARGRAGDEAAATAAVAPKPPASVGLRDVARAAGVSIATVSRAMNTPARVSTQLRLRIEAASRDLGWVPHGAARALTTKRSNAIGAVFPTLSHGDFARAAEALQDELRRSGYTLLLACSNYDPEQEYQLVRQFVERGVDALVLVGALHKPELTSLLQTRGLPSVNTFVYDEKTHGTCIGPDNRKAMHKMTEYLVGLGHRRFGVIAQSIAHNDRAEARLRGIKDVLERNSLELKHLHFAGGRWGVQEGKLLFRKIMASKPNPTAVVCGNAYLAVGAMLEAAALNLAVPGDVSIVGYDDIEIMTELPVSVTTVRVRSDEVGRRAGQYLMARLEERPIGIEWECEAELVKRDSAGPAPRRKRAAAA